MESKLVSLSQAIDEWLIYNHRHTERTQGHYRAVIQRFVDSLDIVYINELQHRLIQHYIDQLIATRKNRTGNSHLTALRSFCRWLSKTYDVPNHTAKIENLKEDPSDARFLTPQQYERVLGVVNGSVRDVVVFLAHTGLRATEFCGLTWDDINDSTLIVRKGKGRKGRTVPLNETCKQILDQLKKQNSEGYIFSASVIYRERERFYAKTPKQRAKQLRALKYSWKHKISVEAGRKMHRRLLYTICTNAAQDAGIRTFGPHALRHYFATELLRLHAPITHVSKVLGHGSVKVTENIYWHCLPEYLNGLTDILDKKR